MADTKTVKLEDSRIQGYQLLEDFRGSQGALLCTLPLPPSQALPPQLALTGNCSQWELQDGACGWAARKATWPCCCVGAIEGTCCCFRELLEQLILRQNMQTIRSQLPLNAVASINKSIIKKPNNLKQQRSVQIVIPPTSPD
ncbi:hypothetical protein UY3_11108 [Chelonia mydas]|uniref:Uncharacterized protein n=1 Tax=Chelonia mydas TaxID=8469 RepID=M7BI70_CHEMY|nr:hypothetical protein UY3_11108 [Chelonia mydas]